MKSRVTIVFLALRSFIAAAYDDSGINATIARVEHETRSVRNSTANVQKRISGVKNEISRVNSDTRNAELQVNLVKGNISRAQYDISHIRSEIDKHENDKRQFDDLFKQYEAQKDKLKEDIKCILQKIHKLQNEIEVKEDARKALIATEARFKELIRLSSDIQRLMGQVKDSGRRLNESHQQWLESFITLAEEKRSDFANISGLDDYRAQLSESLQFVAEVPSDHELIQQGQKLRERISETTHLQKRIQEILRDLALMRGISVVLEKTNEREILDHLKFLDEALESNTRELNRLSSFVDAQDGKRAYLREAVPTLWHRILAMRLHAVNVESANQIIAVGHDQVLWQSFFQDASIWLNDQKRRYQDFHLDYCPRHGIAVLKGALAKIDQIVEDLTNRTTSRKSLNSYLFEYIDVFSDQRVRFARYLSDIEADLLEEDDFARERQRQVDRVFDRRSERIMKDPTCVDAALSLLSGASGVEAERAFLVFNRKC